jgi:N6-L-threonylcarbamoyladenine synthase
MVQMNITILGIESSCDDTAAAVIENGFLLSNKIADQQVHKDYGGVVPELASRAHQQNIVPVVEAALKEAGKLNSDISAVAYTRGPGLMGALLVGSSFAKGFSIALKIPLIDINHLHAHILSVFIARNEQERTFPDFPFLCLLVSGGHTQLIVVKNHLEFEIIGQTMDDAAGEAFDKCAKVMGLPYPGGPWIDKYACTGDAKSFTFARTVVQGLGFSFSGLKTSFLYFLRDRVKENKSFIAEHLNDLCAAIQEAIISSLMQKLVMASKETGINEIAVAGGVSANSALRKSLHLLGTERNWRVFIPAVQYSTDNAAMIAVTGYYKYLSGQFSAQHITPAARFDHL